VLRGITLVGSAVLFIVGLGHLPIAEATAINFVQPSFVTALSIVFLSEQVGIRRWTATIVGLIGILVVIRPGAGAVQVAALFPLSSALCFAIAVVVTRKMGTSDRSETTLLWTALTGLMLLTIMVPFDFVLPTPGEIGIGLVLGALASVGQYLIIIAYRRGSASTLAPFSYVQLLFSTALGLAVFGAVPDRFTLLGAVIIIASGLYTAHRERVRGRERRERAAHRT
jgi:drug/metabolite transporter (DMT)-like permease